MHRNFLNDAALSVLLLFCLTGRSQALNFLPPELKSLSRRDALLLVGGGVAYGKVAGDIIQRANNVRPKGHLERAESTFELAIRLADEAPSLRARRSGVQRGDAKISQPAPLVSADASSSTLRVLEVGIGRELWTVNHGLYDKSVDYLARRQDDSFSDNDSLTLSGGHGLTLVGIDIEKPINDKVAQASAALKERGSGCGFNYGTDEPLPARAESEGGGVVSGQGRGSWNVKYVQGDASSLPFADSAFDVVTCCMTLCSVPDQAAVVKEIRRVLKPRGGTFGWVEHVAVRDGDGRPFLDWQQRVLDPLQQVVANNCHLHRDTDSVIHDVFGLSDVGGGRLVKQERFFVDMWPVSCQSCGVVVTA